MVEHSILLQPGERGLIVGQTGSGKTYFAVWMLHHEPKAPVLIFDTKDEDKFPLMPNARTVSEWMGKNSVMEALEDEKTDYVVFRPSEDHIADPMALDGFLRAVYNGARGSGPMSGVTVYIDEIYSFHKHGQAGPGLVALLTRGRSRGLKTIMATQRPAWLSRFAITEAQRYYVFRLVDERDRKALDGVIPRFNTDYEAANGDESNDTGAMKDNMFFYFANGMKRAQLMRPVKLDGKFNTGYSAAPQASDIGGRLSWL